MPGKIDLVSVPFGRLLVLKEMPKRRNGKIVWKCLCRCGNETETTGDLLRSGRTQSCGCLQKETATIQAKKQAKLNIKHGRRYTREYGVWADMINRCENPKHSEYKNYGGRGIKVCRRWRESFEAFFEDMGPRSNGLSLERINNDLGYFFGNCKWATNEEQQNNKRTCRPITWKGQTFTAAQWGRKLGFHKNTIGYRAAHGLALDRGRS